MANKIKIKNSGVADNQPTAEQLDLGELALNYADGKIFYKDNIGTIQEISGVTFDQSLNTTDDVLFNTVQFSGGTGEQGTLSWNADEETIDLIQNGATLQVGQELQVHCKNNTGAAISNGTVVMATGTLGTSGRITIAPYDGTADTKYIIGITTEDIANAEDGKVTSFGKVRDVDTSAYAEGSVLYASANGGLTAIEPSTGVKNAIAFVINSHENNGTLMVRFTPVDENLYIEKEGITKSLNVIDTDGTPEIKFQGQYTSSGYYTYLREFNGQFNIEGSNNFSALNNRFVVKNKTGTTENFRVDNYSGYINMSPAGTQALRIEPTQIIASQKIYSDDSNYYVDMESTSRFKNLWVSGSLSTNLVSIDDASSNPYVYMSYNNITDRMVLSSGTVGSYSGLDVNGTVNATSYIGDGSQLTGIATGSEHYSQETEPTGIGLGTTWFVPSEATTYLRVNDGVGDIWIEQAGAGTSSGGAVGGGSDAAFYENDQVITTDYSITEGKNAMTAGPVTINDGVTITVPDGSNWVII